MYSTCLFCHAALGANETIEHFPVGRRLVFDAARGRLWVVCRACERWNLTPIEERWEAIEECERAFEGTRLRVSTDNIGLARMPEGLELIRIGSPLRPEMAAWRYGDQFGRRRKRTLIYTGAGAAAAIGIVIAGPVTGMIAMGSMVPLWNGVNAVHSAYRAIRVRARVTLPGYDKPVAVRQSQLHRASIVSHEGSWGVKLPYQPVGERFTRLKSGLRLQNPRWQMAQEESTVLAGDDAMRALARLLPAINARGAKRDAVDAAVRMIGEAPEPVDLMARLARDAAEKARRQRTRVIGEHVLAKLPTNARLALEMATHEDSERRALEGELSRLEDEWRIAEEIAAISDDMFVPGETRRRLADLKQSSTDPEDSKD